jgi:uncharacterized membrane protein
MKSVAIIVGMVLFVLGLDWVGQGTGYFPFPRTDIVNDFQWAYYGAGLALLGCAVIWLADKSAQ